VNYLQRPV